MKVTEIPAKPKKPQIIRVGAYARVSADKDAAFHSLEAQEAYYKDYVSSHEDWELVAIYSDNGISGTIINRPEFLRMLEDCRNKKLDLIITKSVTRFARNTVVLLETIRELKRLGIDVFFEKEAMHSISPDGELLLTLLAMYAEEEARSVSENQLWRIRKLYSEGKPAGGHTYGYRYQDGTFVVVPEEAEVVKSIFAMYLSGMSFSQITRELTVNKVPPIQSEKWHINTVREILNNEKYTGDMILQKKYHDDFRTKKTVKNHGEKRRYLVEDSHEAIISKEDFKLVQEELITRREKYKAPSSATSKSHLFSGLLKCNECGASYQYSRTYSKKYDKAIWVCSRYHAMGKAVCASKAIPEDILIERTKTALEVDDLSRELLLKKLDKIIISNNRELFYYLKDGSNRTLKWEYPSRSKSWTLNMREKAREKSLKILKEREINGQSDDH